MALHPLAGKPAPADVLIDVAKLEREFLDRTPDPNDPRQRVKFGTSGHRGTPLDGSLTAAHIAAITQAICDYRAGQSIDGPLYMGMDTHALSALSQDVALEVLAGNGVETIVQRDGGFTPTPVISRAILARNHGRSTHLADGIVITPSHNPPEDGGFKYNPPHGGPADTDVTGRIQQRANELLAAKNSAVKRVPLADATKASTTHHEDLVLPYVDDLNAVVDIDAIRDAGVTIGVDPLGGASLPYWQAIAARHGLTDYDRQLRHRPGVFLHDARPRRQNPHGLLEPLRDGGPGGAEGSVSGVGRQRPGCRPARHRDGVGWIDESESLPGGCDPVSARQPAGLAGATRPLARPSSAAR